MKRFFGFLCLTIVTATFPFLLSAAQQDDIFGGDNVEKVIAKAKAGDAEAQMALAQRYRFGVGVPQDSAAAVEWFKKAAEQGNVQGQFSVGYMYAAGENGFEVNPAKAAEWYRKAAGNGHLNAQLNLGMMYKTGAGVEKNMATALLWLQKAANQGYASAQMNLGMMYKDGDGVEKNMATALSWFHKAADQGYASAQMTLGTMYKTGAGVEKNMGTALFWLQKAADQGYVPAQIDLGQMYANGDGIEKDTEKAIEFYKKAAEQGHVAAQLNLADIYAKGKNLNAAMDLYLEAAEQENSHAQYNIGLMYYVGQGVKEDLAAAAQWFKKAAQQRNYNAQEDLGHMYLEGKGVEKDEVEGLAWLYIADSYHPFPYPIVSNDISELEKELGAATTQAARRRSEELKQTISSEPPFITEIRSSKPAVSEHVGNPTGISSANSLITEIRSFKPAVSEPIGNPTGNGIGAIISRDGLVLTSARAVAGAESIKIKTPLSARMLPAKILEIDKDNDIAILKYEDTSMPLPVASSGHIRVDQKIIVLLPSRSLETNQGAVFSFATVHSLTGANKNPGYLQIEGGAIIPQPGQPIADDSLVRKIRADFSERLLSSTGGQALDESGNLIGIIPPMDLSEEGFIYVLRSEALRPLLKKHGVDIVDNPETETKKTVYSDVLELEMPIIPIQSSFSLVTILTY